MAVPLGPFGAGVAIALLGLRLLLAVAQFVRNKRRRHVKTLVVLGSGGSRRLRCKLVNWTGRCDVTQNRQRSLHSETRTAHNAPVAVCVQAATLQK